MLRGRKIESVNKRHGKKARAGPFELAGNRNGEEIRGRKVRGNGKNRYG